MILNKHAAGKGNIFIHSTLPPGLPSALFAEEPRFFFTIEYIFDSIYPNICRRREDIRRPAPGRRASQTRGEIYTMILQTALSVLIGYALGNFSPAFLLGRTKGYDVREEGSGNVGATNVFILLGKNAFFITALLDMFKAFAACHLCAAAFPALPTAAALGGAGCILGHIYPAALHFRGGKGLASMGGVILAWSWRWFFVFLALAAVIAFGTRYVCLAAPSVSVIFPLTYYWRTGLLASALILLAVAVPVFAKHWENFRRIRTGEEMRTSFIWDKEGELKRIGKWNPKTESQLDRRGR